MDKTDNELDAFKQYIAHKNILVVEGASASGSSTIKAFREMGAKSEQITLANTISAAIHEISTKKPDLVLTDYDLGKSCGLDLLRSQRTNPHAENTVFILVTGNTAQSAVAKAVEDDIDGFLLKPFRPESFRKTIMQSAQQKIHPTPYYLCIEQGKNFMEEGKYTEAETKFTAACTLDQKPCLAFYFLGRLHLMRKSYAKAKDFYEKGLEHNKIHYKCLNGLVEVLTELKMHNECYEVVKKLCQYFPAEPAVLADAVRLAIINAKYEDVEKYYAIYSKLEDNSETLIKNISAALVVCGKYYLQSNNRARAIELLQKAAATSSNSPKILKEIIQTLIDSGQPKEASDFLNYFSEQDRATPSSLLFQFQITNLTANNSAVIAHGHALLAKDIYDEKFFEIMIKRTVEANLIHAADNFLIEACEKYPKLKDHFSSLLKISSNETVKLSQTQ